MARNASATARVGKSSKPRALAPADAEPAPGGAAELEAVRRRLVRLAFDVHDGPLQSLAAAGFGLKDLQHRIDELQLGAAEHEAASTLIQNLLGELTDAERSLRGLVSALEGGHPEISNVEEILRLELQRFGRRCAATVTVSGDDQFQPDTHSQAIAIESILREALTNVAKHSGATAVQIRLQSSRTHLLLEIEDDGNGFDRPEGEAGSMGLTSMRERVNLLGGEFEILSRAGGPTLVTALLRRWRRPAPARAYTRDATSSR